MPQRPARPPNAPTRSAHPSATPSRPTLYRQVPALDPAVLDAQAQAAVEQLLKAGTSRETTRSYASALKYWAGWYRVRYRQPFQLPLPVAPVLQFIVDHVEREVSGAVTARRSPRRAPPLVHGLPRPIDDALVGAGFKTRSGPLSLATVHHRLAVLSSAHQQRGLVSPTRDPAVQALLEGTRRAYAARDVRPAGKDALTRVPLRRMLATCTDGLIGVRDRALLLFGWSSGGRRRAEISGADHSRLTRVGPARYVYRLGRTKTQPSGADRDPHAYKPVQGSAGRALDAWIEASGLHKGRLFRRIRRRGPTTDSQDYAAEPLSPQAVWRIVKRRAELAGLRGDYGAHSLRAGFITEAGRQNLSLGDTMALTSHRSVTTVMRYHRPAQMAQSGAANLYDAARSKRGVRRAGQRQKPQSRR